jgi:hypothetical protein
MTSQWPSPPLVTPSTPAVWTHGACSGSNTRAIARMPIPSAKQLITCTMHSTDTRFP